MRKIVIFMHISLDGFVGRLKGEMDWIQLEDEIFDYAGKRTKEADTALYGRVTWQMMENYWPTAGDKPDATKHDIEHSTWYNKVEKVVISKTVIEHGLKNTMIISENPVAEIRKIKNRQGKDILLLGSPSVVHMLLKENLIDEFWLFVNPVLLGEGIPLFGSFNEQINLKLVLSKTMKSGVVCLHYQKSE